MLIVILILIVKVIVTIVFIDCYCPLYSPKAPPSRNTTNNIVHSDKHDQIWCYMLQRKGVRCLCYLGSRWKMESFLETNA
jgi:hypothetical protein